MATRTSIKSKAKAKAGAVLATAAAGIAFTSEAAELSPLEANAALLEAAFKLLEEGQQQALTSADSASPSSEFAEQQAAAQQALDNEELAAQMPQAQMGVQMAAAGGETLSDVPSQMFAQAETVAQTAGEAAGGAGGAAGSGAAGAGAAGAGAAASGAGALVAAAPLATALGIGAGVVGAAAVANSISDSGTAGSDLNDGPASGLAIDSNQVVNIVGKSVDKTEVTSEAVGQKLSLIGANYLDDHLNNSLLS